MSLNKTNHISNITKRAQINFTKIKLKHNAKKFGNNHSTEMLRSRDSRIYRFTNRYILLYLLIFCAVLCQASRVITFPKIERNRRQCSSYYSRDMSPCTRVNQLKSGNDFKNYQQCLKVNGSLVPVSKTCPCCHYFDRKEKECIRAPGGGDVVYVDYCGKCTGDYIGTLVHPTQAQFYYVCKDCLVIVMKCPRLKIFDSEKRQCVDIKNPCTMTIHDESDGSVETPACKSSGRYPIPYHPEYFYMCTEDGDKFYRSIFKCQFGTQYDPETQRCSVKYNGLTTTQRALGWYLENDPYPPCVQPGRFRSPKNCSMYYICSAKTRGTFYQSRFSCPSGKLFCMKTFECRPSEEVDCDISNNCTGIGDCGYSTTETTTHLATEGYKSRTLNIITLPISIASRNTDAELPDEVGYRTNGHNNNETWAIKTPIEITIAKLINEKLENREFIEIGDKDVKILDELGLGETTTNWEQILFKDNDITTKNVENKEPSFTNDNIAYILSELGLGETTTNWESIFYKDSDLTTKSEENKGNRYTTGNIANILSELGLGETTTNPETIFYKDSDLTTKSEEKKGPRYTTDNIANILSELGLGETTTNWESILYKDSDLTTKSKENKGLSSTTDKIANIVNEFGLEGTATSWENYLYKDNDTTTKSEENHGFTNEYDSVSVLTTVQGDNDQIIEYVQNDKTKFIVNESEEFIIYEHENGNNNKSSTQGSQGYDPIVDYHNPIFGEDHSLGYIQESSTQGLPGYDPISNYNDNSSTQRNPMYDPIDSHDDPIFDEDHGPGYNEESSTQARPDYEAISYSHDNSSTIEIFQYGYNEEASTQASMGYDPINWGDPLFGKDQNLEYNEESSTQRGPGYDIISYSRENSSNDGNGYSENTTQGISMYDHISFSQNNSITGKNPQSVYNQESSTQGRQGYDPIVNSHDDTIFYDDSHSEYYEESSSQGRPGYEPDSLDNGSTDENSHSATIGKNVQDVYNEESSTLGKQGYDPIMYSYDDSTYNNENHSENNEESSTLGKQGYDPIMYSYDDSTYNNENHSENNEESSTLGKQGYDPIMYSYDDSTHNDDDHLEYNEESSTNGNLRYENILNLQENFNTESTLIAQNSLSIHENGVTTVASIGHTNSDESQYSIQYKDIAKHFGDGNENITNSKIVTDNGFHSTVSNKGSSGNDVEVVTDETSQINRYEEGTSLNPVTVFVDDKNHNTVTYAYDETMTTDTRQTDSDCSTFDYSHIKLSICQSQGIFSLNGSCSQYYHCKLNENGELEAEIYQCPKCLRFNEDKGYCDLPTNVPRCLPEYLKRHIKTCREEGLFMIQGECQKYKKCFRNKYGEMESKIMSCPEGTNFNEAIKECDKSFKCTESRPHPKCNASGYFPDEDRCNEFYECIENSSSNDDSVRFSFKRYKCELGTVFNDIKGICDLVENVPWCVNIDI